MEKCEMCGKVGSMYLTHCWNDRCGIMWVTCSDVCNNLCVDVYELTTVSCCVCLSKL